MLIKKPADIRSSEITDQKLFLNRREFLRAAGVATAQVTGPRKNPERNARRPAPAVRGNGTADQPACRVADPPLRAARASS